jgi:hypothetical protein
MNRREFIAASACAAAVGAAAVEPTKGRYEVGAYYFPGWHVDPRMEELHGKGWTEWELLKRGEPKFPGHAQPKRPAWGYGDESDPRVFEKKIAAAHQAGLSHFIFDWYWYDGKPFLQRPLEHGYQGAGNKKDVRFCLMWANHDWQEIFPGRLGEASGKLNRPLIFKGTYDAAEFDRVIDYVISHYFGDPSYYCVDGAPYFSIYELKHLMERMGGVEVFKAALRRFREKTKSAGFPDLHLNVVAGGLNGLDSARELLPVLNVKSVTNYTWAHYYPLPNFPTNEYQDAMECATAYWMKTRDMFGVPYHLDVSIGWDPSPRSCQSDHYQRADYPFTPILTGNTPQQFQSALARAKAYMDSHSDVPKVLTINSWNEWTEGSYLEPDQEHDTAYLEAIRRVFGGS